MSSPLACQTYRLAFLLRSARKAIIASDSLPTDAKLCAVMKSVRSRKKRSTKFSQDEEVGVKCMWKRGCLDQPSFDFGVLVSGVIVGDEMDVESGRRLVIDGLEKGQPLLVAVTLGDAGDQFTVEVVQRGEQGERPVAEVVVGLGLDVADPQGQTRLGALERLALRFLIAAEDQSFLRRIEIEPDHIPELLLKLLVLGQLEGARQMRLDVVGRPQALDGGFRHAGPAG